MILSEFFVSTFSIPKFPSNYINCSFSLLSNHACLTQTIARVSSVTLLFDYFENFNKFHRLLNTQFLNYDRIKWKDKQSTRGSVRWFNLIGSRALLLRKTLMTLKDRLDFLLNRLVHVIVLLIFHGNFRPVVTSY